MIRRWELAFWALLAGTTAAEVSCEDTPLYGVPVDWGYDFQCTCEMPCEGGEPPWFRFYDGSSVTWAQAEAVQDCNADAEDQCAVAPTEDCTCTCEETD